MNNLFLSFLSNLRSLFIPQNPSIFHYFLYIFASLILFFCGFLAKILPGLFKNLQEKEYKKEENRLQLELKIKTMEEEGKKRRAKNYIIAQEKLTNVVNKICESQEKMNKILYEVKKKTGDIEKRTEDIWFEIHK